MQIEQGVGEAKEECQGDGGDEGGERADIQGLNQAPDEADQDDAEQGDERVNHEPAKIAANEAQDGAAEEPALGDALLADAGEEDDEGPEDGVEVADEVVMADVEAVEAHFVGQDEVEVVVHQVVRAEAGFFVVVGDGGGAGDAGADGEDFAAVVGGVGLEDLGVFGAGADEAHVADEDVPKLGQLVELGVTQPVAEGGDAVVAVGGDAGAGVAFGALVHGAELEDLEDAAVLADAIAAVVDGAGVLALDAEGDPEEEGREEEQAEDGGRGCRRCV